MLTYIIKRLLLMIPTFFAICVLVFVILNFAPGNPGGRQIGSEGGQQSNTGEQRESYRLFKEQFNLDKPILFNTRYKLSEAEVEQALKNILNLSGDVPPADRIQAQDDIENWGRYAVPALMALMQNAPEAEVQAIASQRLTVNARRRLQGEFRADLTPEQRAFNKEVVEEINSMRGKYFVVGDVEDANATSKEESIAFWTEWYDANQAAWNYSFSDKTGIFLLDTRFAKYFSNLLQLELSLGTPLPGFQHEMDRRELQEELLRHWVATRLEPALQMHRPKLEMQPNAIEIVVSLPEASWGGWTVPMQDVLVHDGALATLAVALPLVATLRHTESACLTCTAVGIVVAAGGASWLLTRYALRVAPFYATTALAPLLLLPLQFHATTTMVDEWRNSKLYPDISIYIHY